MASLRIRRPPEWGVDPVPERLRTLRAFDLFVLWSSLGVGLLVLWAGTLLVFQGLSILEILGVSLVGSVIGSLMLAGAARHGSRAGVPTMVSLRPILGRTGSYVPTALNVLQLLGWAAFELLVMGYAAAVVTNNALGPWTAAIFVPIFGAIVAALALGGPLVVVRQWLEKFAIWLVYGSTAAIAIALVLRGLDANSRPLAGAFAGPASYLLALDLVIVMPVSWWPLVSDYNRFARSGKASAVGTTAGYAVANTAFYVLGAALLAFGMTRSPPVADFLAAIGLLGLGLFPLLFILVDETDNAFANVYSTAVSLQNLSPRRRQFWAIIAATGIAMAGAWFLLARGEGIGGGYELFLFLVGGLFVPLLGVVIADSFLVRRGGYQPEEFLAGPRGVRWPAFASWAPGIILYLGIVYNWIPGFPPVGATLPSFAISAGLQVLFCKVEALLVNHRRPVPGGRRA